MDHADPFPHGPTSTTNTGALCADCHAIKTAGHVVIDHSAADGSGTWRTAWGQTVRITPTRYLDNGGTPDSLTTDQPSARRGSTRRVFDRLAEMPRPRVIPKPPDTGDDPPF